MSITTTFTTAVKKPLIAKYGCTSCKAPNAFLFDLQVEGKASRTGYVTREKTISKMERAAADSGSNMMRHAEGEMVYGIEHAIKYGCNLNAHCSKCQTHQPWSRTISNALKFRRICTIYGLLCIPLAILSGIIISSTALNIYWLIHVFIFGFLGMLLASFIVPFITRLILRFRISRLPEELRPKVIRNIEES